MPSSPMLLILLPTMMTFEVDPSLLSRMPSPLALMMVTFSMRTLSTFFRKIPSPLTSRIVTFRMSVLSLAEPSSLSVLVYVRFSMIFE